jgi:hypothetical protein
MRGRADRQGTRDDLTRGQPVRDNLSLDVHIRHQIANSRHVDGPIT